MASFNWNENLNFQKKKKASCLRGIRNVYEDVEKEDVKSDRNWYCLGGGKESAPSS